MPKLPELYYDPSLPLYYDVERVRYHQQHLPDLSERYAQCCGDPDGREFMLTPKGGDAPVLLHDQCWTFYRTMKTEKHLWL